MKQRGMTFVDVRDRYGITQIVFNEADNKELCDAANKLGREFRIQVKGVVSETSVIFYRHKLVSNGKCLYFCISNKYEI